MTPTCQNCKYWKLLDDCYRRPGWGRCAIGRSEGGEAVCKETLAVAVDYEEYIANLVTLPTFSCNQHTPREE